MKKEGTRKRKENNNTRKKEERLHKESAKPKFNRIVKLTKTKHAKGKQRQNKCVCEHI